MCRCNKYSQLGSIRCARSTHLLLQAVHLGDVVLAVRVPGLGALVYLLELARQQLLRLGGLFGLVLSMCERNNNKNNRYVVN